MAGGLYPSATWYSVLNGCPDVPAIEAVPLPQNSMRLTTSISGSSAPPGPPVRGMPIASAAALTALPASDNGGIVLGAALGWPYCAWAHWKANVAIAALASTFIHFAFVDMPPPQSCQLTNPLRFAQPRNF